MSEIWQHANTERPCLVCGKTDWCTFGDKAMLCQRVQSSHPAAKGGWYHFYDELKGVKRFEPPKPKAAPQQINAGAMMRRWRNSTLTAAFCSLAKELGVLPEALVAIGAGWAEERKAWAFPMRDGHGETIGIRLRNAQGQKWAVTGSRQGIFLPEPSVKVQSPAYLPEGPTDAAAGLSLGLFTVGRPTATSGMEHVNVALKRLGIYKAVLVADNDELKQIGDGFGYPGIKAMTNAKKQLQCLSVIWQPTGKIKDLRQFVNEGGTKVLIESQVKERIWKRG